MQSIPECLQTLRFDEFTARRDRVQEAHPNTGKWLEEDRAYQEWKTSNGSSLLCIRGKPGSGKSTLAKAILISMKKNYGITNKPKPDAWQDVLIADFFYSFRGGVKETSHGLMLQSILYQLLNQDERLFPLFQKVYRTKRSVGNVMWQYEDLREIFASLSSL